MRLPAVGETVSEMVWMFVLDARRPWWKIWQRRGSASLVLGHVFFWREFRVQASEGVTDVALFIAGKRYDLMPQFCGVDVMPLVEPQTIIRGTEIRVECEFPSWGRKSMQFALIGAKPESEIA